MTSRQLRIVHALTASALALAFGVTAQASASRTFVSTIGNDANTSVNCSPSANCRTFAAALSVTNSGGEVVVLTSGGYGPATISQSVVITAIGIDASISVTTSGANGLTINTPGNVTLIGLNLHGEGTGNNGIEVQQVGFLRLYNMLIENFTNIGVDFEVTGQMAIYGSTINDNAFAGLLVANGTANVYVHDTAFDHNTGVAVEVDSGQVTIADSSAEYNGTGFLSQGSLLTLVNDRAIFNAVAMHVLSAGTLYFGNCLFANNAFAYEVVSGSTLAGTNPGTSIIAPGQSTSGTLSTALSLH